MYIYIKLKYYFIILTLSLLFKFLRLFNTFEEVLKVAKTLTFETNLISFPIETGVFPKPIAIE